VCGERAWPNQPLKSSPYSWLLLAAIAASLFTWTRLARRDHRLVLIYVAALLSAFFGANGDGKIPQDLFFSFTTLTTTGYGNLVPAGNPGQSFAVAEMLIGQLFLVIAVAKVINAYTPLRLPRSGSQQAGGNPSGGSAGGESP